MARGFTLFEMLVTLTILALVSGLVLLRGPPRSAALDLRASAGEVAGALRQTRAQAIASGRTTIFVLDVAAHGFRSNGGAIQALSPRLALSVTTVSGEVTGQRAGITFAPDGSSSGGRVGMAEGGRRVLVGVDWLTGRVSVADGE